ncbi:MAG: substrate-binding domain-containing protein [Desulfobacterales bacterium]|nr:MAG: substrate-binding domain-containing protein [Desulfobacterales bacterium]
MNRSIVAATCLVLVVCLLPLSSLGEENVLTMATTTSTDNTGLLDDLAPKFKAATEIELKWTATGTGKALKLGENCDVDVLMVHAPPAEKAFVDSGFGIDRHEVMTNDFVIIGPAHDPAKINGKSIQHALQALQAKQATFVSRGDNSGTHKKELSLWKAAGLQVPDRETWYVQAGQGMLTTINIAAERDGYTMTDRGTYLKYEENMGGNPPLEIIVQDDTVLLNQYSVIDVNPKHCPKVRHDLAMPFIHWITGPEAQLTINDFKLLGKPLFKPNAKKIAQQ